MITIAGYTVPQNPADVKVSRFDLTKSNRSASGVMNMEIIRPGVRRVDVIWNMMPDDVFKALLDVLAVNKPFFTLRYPDAGGEQSMICYAGDISAGLWYTQNGVRYWEEVSVPFIER